MSIKNNTTSLQELLEAVNNLPEAGGKTEWNTFWDIFQDNGNRTNYGAEFRQGWNDINFKPKYNIIVKNNCDNLFQNSKITDLKQILLDCGISFDMSQSYGCYYFGSYSKLTHVPEMGSTS